MMWGFFALSACGLFWVLRSGPFSTREEALKQYPFQEEDEMCPESGVEHGVNYVLPTDGSASSYPRDEEAHPLYQDDGW